MNNENVFGLPVNVGTPEEVDAAMDSSDRPHFIVVMRCEDQPADTLPAEQRARNRRTLCEVCSAVCWYDAVQYRHHKATFICIPCHAEKLKAGQKFEIVADRDHVAYVQDMMARERLRKLFGG